MTIEISCKTCRYGDFQKGDRLGFCLYQVSAKYLPACAVNGVISKRRVAGDEAKRCRVHERRVKDDVTQVDLEDWLRSHCDKEGHTGTR